MTGQTTTGSASRALPANNLRVSMTGCNLPQPATLAQYIIRCAHIFEDGLACWSYVVFDTAGEELLVDFGGCGHGPSQSSQSAAYTAILQAGKWIADCADGASVLIESHDKGVVDQLTGAARVGALKPLRDAAAGLLAGTGTEIRWIPSETNEAARRYAHTALIEAQASRRAAAA